MTRKPWKNILWVIGVVPLFSTWSAISTAQAQSAPPATVVDYFLRLPHHYFEGTRTELKDSIFGKEQAKNLIVDTKNYYIYFPGDEAQSDLTVTLFRDHGRILVAVLDGGYDPAIPTLDFLRYDHKRWVNVTKSVLPLPFNNRLTYILPRYGTMIQVRDGHGGTVYDLQWRRGRFHVG